MGNKINKAELIEMKNAGKKGKEIAEYFGVSQGFVSQEWDKIKNEQHKYLPMEKSDELLAKERDMMVKAIMSVKMAASNKETIAKAIKGHMPSITKMGLEDVEPEKRHQLLLKYMAEERQQIRNFSDIEYTWQKDAYEKEKDRWKEYVIWLLQGIKRKDEVFYMDAIDKMHEMQVKGGM